VGICEFGIDGAEYEYSSQSGNTMQDLSMGALAAVILIIGHIIHKKG